MDRRRRHRRSDQGRTLNHDVLHAVPEDFARTVATEIVDTGWSMMITSRVTRCREHLIRRWTECHTTGRPARRRLRYGGSAKGSLGLTAMHRVKWSPDRLDTLGAYEFVSDVPKCRPSLGHNRFAGRSSGQIVAREQSVAQSVFIIGISLRKNRGRAGMCVNLRASSVLEKATIR